MKSSLLSLDLANYLMTLLLKSAIFMTAFPLIGRQSFFMRSIYDHKYARRKIQHIKVNTGDMTTNIILF